MDDSKSTIVKHCPSCGKEEPIHPQIIKSWQGHRYTVCDDCGSWYLNPRPHQEYEDNYWGETIDIEGKTRRHMEERDFKLKNWYCDTIPFVNKSRPGNVLDIGAGLGFFLSAIDSKWKKYAVEISKTGCDFMRKSFPDIEVHNKYLSDCTFQDDYFDIVMFYHVIEHLSDPGDVLKDIFRILRPGGILITGTPNVGSWIAKRYKGNYRQLGPGHTCLFNPKSLEEILLRNGFNTFKVEYPFWKTDYAKLKNLIKLLNPKVLSPPFKGSIMTTYARKVN